MIRRVPYEVVQDDQTPRSQDTQRFAGYARSGVAIEDGRQKRERETHVERSVLVGQPLRICDGEADAWIALAGSLYSLGQQVDSAKKRGVGAIANQVVQHLSRTAADIKDANLRQVEFLLPKKSEKRPFTTLEEVKVRGIEKGVPLVQAKAAPAVVCFSDAIYLAQQSRPRTTKFARQRKQALARGFPSVPHLTPELGLTATPPPLVPFPPYIPARPVFQ